MTTGATSRFIGRALLVVALLWAIAPTAYAAPPTNDDFDNAELIGSVPFNATLDTLESTAAPDDPGCFGSRPTVWYRFIAPASSRILANTFGSDYNTTLSVYTGARGALTQIACNDDVSFSLLSQVSFDAVAGTTYYFMVGGSNDLFGSLQFSVDLGLPNDDITGATSIVHLPFSDTLDTTQATTAAGFEPNCSNVSSGPTATVWYTYTPSANTRLVVKTFGSDYDTLLGVFSGTPQALSIVGCNNDARGTQQSEVSFDTVAGQTYFLSVGQYISGPGGHLALAVEQAPPPPANDDITGAVPIAALPFTVALDTAQATAAPDDPNCFTSGATVWYVFTPAVDTPIDARTIGSNYDTTLGVYTGAPGALTEVVCNNDFGFETNGSVARLIAQAGQTYYLMVGANAGQIGADLVFSMTTIPPPPNDDIATATNVDVGFVEIVTAIAATSAADDPTCFGNGPTIWYTFTPLWNTRVEANTFASGDVYNTTLSVYVGARGALTQIACNDDAAGTQQSQIIFDAVAGQTYYFMIGSSGSGPARDTAFSLIQGPPPPPANDNFAAVARVAALPFDGSIDTTSATMEPGEPTPACVQSYGLTLDHTVWYAFTPRRSGPITARVLSGPTPAVIAAYTGGGLASLTPVGERCLGDPLTFRARAGTTYYLQVGGMHGFGGLVQLRIEPTPPPVADFTYAPSDPSTFDAIQFFNSSSDLGGVEFKTQVWDFGDGMKATDCCPIHRYVKDGNYTVRLRVTTRDGRTGTTSQVVQVKTHDIAIKQLSAPRSARIGQTRRITVAVSNRRYPESVEVQLYKRTAAGDLFVGTLTRQAPARWGNYTTDFIFNYTFTPDDAADRSVTFIAVATILGARDARPADNQATARPTLVTR
jgi:hypothetical protein